MQHGSSPGTYLDLDRFDRPVTSRWTKDIDDLDPDVDFYKVDHAWDVRRPTDTGPHTGRGLGITTRMLKEQLLWVHCFVDAEDVRRAVTAWIEVYNENWLTERHGHRPPAAVRRELLAVKVPA